MESHSNNSSYPDSGDFSPRVREIDFEGAPNMCDDSSVAGTTVAGSYKVKFLCSYGGKIQPRPHDNQLSYVGGDTKIITVERSIRYSSFMAKLSALAENDASSLLCKYQLPGEDLDALISVTNDEDLEHLMHEYDRLTKPNRMRLFLFPYLPSYFGSFGFDGDVGEKSDRDRFVAALNSIPPLPEVAATPLVKPLPSPNKVDFLFGLEKGLPAPLPPQPQMLQLNYQNDQQQLHVRVAGFSSGRATDDFFTGNEHQSQTHVPDETTAPTPVPAYWPEKNTSAIGGGFPVLMTQHHQPVHVFPGPGGGIMMRPVINQQSHGYYIQRMGEVPGPPYGVLQPPPQAIPLSQRVDPPQIPADTPAGYTPMAYYGGGTVSGGPPVAKPPQGSSQ